jgi:hypothetical protein
MVPVAEATILKSVPTATGGGAIAARSVAFNPASSKCAQHAADNSKVLKDSSTIVIGNELITAAMPLPPNSHSLLA